VSAAFQVFITLQNNPDDSDDGNESFYALTDGSLTTFTLGFFGGDRNSVTVSWWAIGV
jgi:hypothetical protein